MSDTTVRACHGQPGQSVQSSWVSLLPFALMIGIFYVLVLLPMRRRQKKVQDFQAALKVGDRVITTSGIYGQITKLDDKTVQIQIADKVRHRRRPGRDRRLSGSRSRSSSRTAARSNSCTRTFVGSSSSIAVGDRAGDLVAFTPPQPRRSSSGLDLKGGVHLVLQVKTDDALRLETETASEQLQAALKDAGHHRHRAGAEPHRVHGRGRAGRQRSAVPARSPTQQVGDVLRPRAARAAAATRSG